ncbi:hypothetical protein U9470_22910, partial [Escherichia coli]
MPHVAARTASRDRDTGRYQSHRPEQTLLYQIVDEYYPAFAALMAEQGKELPGYVQREFEEFLQSPRRRATSRSLIVETIGLCHAGQGDFRQAIRALGVRLERWPSQIL